MKKKDFALHAYADGAKMFELANVARKPIWVDGEKTDKLYTAYTVYTNRHDTLTVKVEDDGNLVTREEVLARIETDKPVMVSFEGGVVTMYVRDNELLTSAKAAKAIVSK